MGYLQQPVMIPFLPAVPGALCTVYSAVFGLFDAILFTLFHLFMILVM